MLGLLVLAVVLKVLVVVFDKVRIAALLLVVVVDKVLGVVLLQRHRHVIGMRYPTAVESGSTVAFCVAISACCDDNLRLNLFQVAWALGS